MTDTVDMIGVQLALAAACRAAGSQKAWAAAHGVSAQYVCDVAQGRKDPGPAILDGLGLYRLPLRYARKRTPINDEPRPGATGTGL